MLVLLDFSSLKDNEDNNNKDKEAILVLSDIFSLPLKDNEDNSN